MMLLISPASFFLRVLETADELLIKTQQPASSLASHWLTLSQFVLLTHFLDLPIFVMCLQHFSFKNLGFEKI